MTPEYWRSFVLSDEALIHPDSVRSRARFFRTMIVPDLRAVVSTTSSPVRAFATQAGGDFLSAVRSFCVFFTSPAALASSSISTVTACHCSPGTREYTVYRFAMLTAELGRP